MSPLAKSYIGPARPSPTAGPVPVPRKSLGAARAVVLAALALAPLCLQGMERRAAAAEAELQPLDLSAWQELPVMVDGRIMPLQTQARKIVEKICGRVSPRINLRREVGEQQYNEAPLAKARAIFGPSGSRKFAASELLLSWLVERDAWENVPFILAEHEALRELLDLPLVNEQGQRLRYVAPAQLADSDAFLDRITELRDKDRAASSEMKEFKPTGVDKLVADLWVAFKTYRLASADPRHDVRSRSRFMEKASATFEAWAGLEEKLAPLQAHGGDSAIGELLSQAESARQRIVEVAQRGQFEIVQIEPDVVAFVRATDGLEQHLTDMKAKMTRSAPKSFSPEQIGGLMTLMTQLTTGAKAVSRTAGEMHLALFDEGGALKVVPALNAAALEKDRDTAVDAQPWLALSAVLYGSPDLLKEYPSEPIALVRHWFGAMGEAYTNRQDPDRAEKFAETSRRLGDALRTLAAGIEPRRQKLPIQSLDEALMHYTQYPAAGATRHEVTYNELDPFKWAWVISLLSAVCFALAFGVLRKTMTWVGIGVLLAGIAWSVYGFYLRISITRWAPVTNMYETVLYVPLFVSVLGTLFLLMPLAWAGLTAAWRATALPFTWEAGPLSEEQRAIFREETWQWIGYLMLVPRVVLGAGVVWALAVADYYDGGNTVLSVTPKVSFGALAGNVNALLVWIVGLGVLGLAAWYLPRAILTVVMSPAFVAGAERGRWTDDTRTVVSRRPFGLAATLVAAFLYMIAWYAPVLERGFTPLMPVLRSNFWLTIHVMTIVSSYGAGLLAWGLGLISITYYLFGKYRMPHVPAAVSEGYGPAEGAGEKEAAVAPRPPKQCDVLAHYIYKAVQVAVLLLAAGTILGGLWADVSWGRFWGWDPKEVFALVSLLVYLAVLHGRYAGLFGNFGLTFATVLGASAIAMSWYGVNFVLGVGLHSYGFGEGGQAEVGAFVFLNWVYLGLAGGRYWLATQPVTLRQAQRAEEEAKVE